MKVQKTSPSMCFPSSASRHCHWVNRCCTPVKLLSMAVDHFLTISSLHYSKNNLLKLKMKKQRN